LFAGVGLGVGLKGWPGKLPSVGMGDVNDLAWTDFETEEPVWFPNFNGNGRIGSISAQLAIGGSLTILVLPVQLKLPWYDGNGLNIFSVGIERTFSVGAQELIGDWSVGPCLFGCQEDRLIIA
jgi:hypothetical protein